jgi:anti-sigma factor RsiW
MLCNDTRWGLVHFLEGRIGEEEAEQIREHLAGCPACVDYMIKSGKVAGFTVAATDRLEESFSDKVIAQLGRRDASSALSRLLSWTFAAASLLGISAFAYFRYYLTPQDLAALKQSLPEREKLVNLVPWLQDWLASPAFQYLVLSVAAILICLGLIFAVDLSQQLLRGRNGAEDAAG